MKDVIGAHINLPEKILKRVGENIFERLGSCFRFQIQGAPFASHTSMSNAASWMASILGMALMGLKIHYIN